VVRWAVIGCVALAACYRPSYPGILHCSSEGACPSDYSCEQGFCVQGSASDAGLGTPFQLDEGGGEYVELAADSAGNAVAVWRGSTFDSTEVWARVFDRSSGWGAAERLAVTGDNTDPPAVALDEQGNATALWGQGTGPAYEAAAARYHDHVWTATETLSRAADGPVNRIALAASPDGTAYAAWEQYGASPQVFVGLYQGTWTGPQRLDLGRGNAPRLAASAAGALLVWGETDSGGIRTVSIWTRAYHGSWGAPTELGTVPGDLWEPRAAFRDDGTAVAIWGAGGGPVWASRSLSAGWTTAERIEAGAASEPDLALATDGAPVGVYYLGGSAWRSEGGVTGWTKALLQNADGDFGKGRPGVAAAGPLTVAAWETLGDIWVAARRGVWGPPTRVASSDERTQANPVVAVSADGTTFTAWRSGGHVWALVWRP
jgi:hypothetical protein